MPLNACKKEKGRLSRLSDQRPRRSVSKPFTSDVECECCAKFCISRSKYDQGKNFFSFPSCVVSSAESVQRCKLWVQNSGNVELLKCKPSELHFKYYLCSDHFGYDEFCDSSKMLLKPEAVPAIFNCQPLTEDLMKVFPANEEILSSEATRSSSNSQISELDGAEKASDQESAHLAEDVTLKDVNNGTDSDEMATTINPVREEHELMNSAKEVLEPVCEATKPKATKNMGSNTAVLGKRSTPSRKAKEDAVTKLCNLQQTGKISDEPEAKKVKIEQALKETAGKQNDESNVKKVKGKKVSKDTANEHTDEPNAKEPEAESISLKDHLDLELPELDPGTGTFVSDDSKERDGDSKEGDQNSGSRVGDTKENGRDSTEVFEVSEEQSGKSIKQIEIFKKNISKVIDDVVRGQGEESPKGRCKVLRIVGANSLRKSNDLVDEDRHASEKTAPVVRKVFRKFVVSDQTNKKGKPISIKTVSVEDYKKYVESTAPKYDKRRAPINVSGNDGNDMCVVPSARTTSTQTILGHYDERPQILKILDCNEKLGLFCGIPSFEMLDSITDATLKMVMSNTVMINDVEPTMREWIILTCTKFNLKLSVEVLSLIFEMSQEECRRVLEKTSLFLRKTLSLPDCQQYVVYLPDEVLNGIADVSDSVLT